MSNVDEQRAAYRARVEPSERARALEAAAGDLVEARSVLREATGDA